MTDLRDALLAGTVSLTGHCVRVDFETRDDAEALFEILSDPPTDPSEGDIVERARERFKVATEAIDAAKDELEAARAALAEAHKAAAVEPDLEEWRAAHDAFCYAGGYCFTHGSTDCNTRSRIAGLKAAAPHIRELLRISPAMKGNMGAPCMHLAQDRGTIIIENDWTLSLPASAIEARRAETEGLDAKHESAAAKPDAQTQSGG